MQRDWAGFVACLAVHFLTLFFYFCNDAFWVDMKSSSVPFFSLYKFYFFHLEIEKLQPKNVMKVKFNQKNMQDDKTKPRAKKN